MVVIAVSATSLALAGVTWLKRSARSNLEYSLAAVAHGRLPVESLVQNPTLLSAGEKIELPGLLAKGFLVDSGSLYFQEPGILFRVTLAGDSDLFCLQMGIMDWDTYCTEIARDVLER